MTALDTICAFTAINVNILVFILQNADFLFSAKIR